MQIIHVSFNAVALRSTIHPRIAKAGLGQMKSGRMSKDEESAKGATETIQDVEIQIETNVNTIWRRNENPFIQLRLTLLSKAKGTKDIRADVAI